MIETLSQILARLVVLVGFLALFFITLFPIYWLVWAQVRLIERSLKRLNMTKEFLAWCWERRKKKTGD